MNRSTGEVEIKTESDGSVILDGDTLDRLRREATEQARDRMERNFTRTMVTHDVKLTEGITLRVREVEL